MSAYFGKEQRVNWAFTPLGRTIDTMSFTQAYQKLNTAQRQAVDTLEGPVLVVAGPGTGKTQLLATRAANIVRTTDTPPEAILCLTFTESAALSMRQRLIGLMGPEGNKVAVHTFHSFGTDIINRYPEHFYGGARFTPADDLSSYELLRDIFEELPHSNPLAKTMNGEFTMLKDAKSAISHLKRAGLLPDELLAILEHNKTFCDAAEPRIAKAFADRLSKKSISAIAELIPQLAAMSKDKTILYGYKSLGDMCTAQLAQAADESVATGKTTLLTAWRNEWCEKNNNGELVFKDRARNKKLRSLAHIYQKYRDALIAEELFDFDDMVSMVAHTLESVPELRFSLQEQFLYFMIDEFQDTNGAQLRLLNNLTDNPVNEGRPNVLAVGDDDQAIYAFQGAELSNILDFASRYRNPTIITLTDNYRSTATILQQARTIITQADQRLETTLQHVSKKLTPHNTTVRTIAELHTFEAPAAEYQWVSDHIKTLLAKGTPLNEIAVLGRRHKQLVALLPYLHANKIPVHYERRSNVLESPHICELITLTEVVVALGEQRFDIAESLLPELLSYEFWGLQPHDLWQLSLEAYKQRRMWLELMMERPGKLHEIAEFLILASHQALHEPCETMLDILVGSNEHQVADSQSDDPANRAAAPAPYEGFVSPYRAYHFNARQLAKNPSQYLTLLSNLRVIRQALARYRPNQPLSLRSFIDFIDLHMRTNTPIIDTALQSEGQGVHLMTAHKAKGLEYDTVFVLNCQDTIWGRKARQPSSALQFPHNMPIEPTGASYDDALRLFFVAITRAKRNLYLTCHNATNDGKAAIKAEFLQAHAPAIKAHTGWTSPLDQLAPGWQHRHLHMPHATQTDLLAPMLQTYRLSATHLNNFIDVTRGGPQAFLLQNLLRFPQAITPPLAFGHAMHGVLARAHVHLAATGERRPVEDILHDFELHLQMARLSERDFTYLLEKGTDILQNYLAARYHTFSPAQKAERDFAGQNVTLDGVRLTGAIDLMQIDKNAKTIVVTDYKTGKNHNNWRASTDFDKIKLHKYRQQLMFYKLLVENSRDYAGYTVTQGVLEFIEPDADGRVCQLELAFSQADLTDFRELLKTVWQRIQALDLPDANGYPSTYQGLLAFEKDLLQNADSLN